MDHGSKSKLNDAMQWKGGGQACSALNCTNSRKKCPGLSFFRFPKDPDRCQQWVYNTGRKELEKKTPQQLHTTYCLCPEHFELSQFKNAKQRNKLIHNAVPIKVDVPDPLPGNTLSISPTNQKQEDLSDFIKLEQTSSPSTSSSNSNAVTPTSEIPTPMPARVLRKRQLREKEYKAEDGYFCCASNCKNTRRKDVCKGMTFFHFPWRDEERCREWIQNSGRQDLIRLSMNEIHRRGFLLCSEHFDSGQFNVTSERKHLAYNAIPSIFTGPNSPACVIPKRKRKHMLPPEAPIPKRLKTEQTVTVEQTTEVPAMPTPSKIITRKGGQQNKKVLTSLNTKEPHTGQKTSLLDSVTDTASANLDPASSDDKKPVTLINEISLTGVNKLNDDNSNGLNKHLSISVESCHSVSTSYVPLPNNLKALKSEPSLLNNSEINTNHAQNQTPSISSPVSHVKLRHSVLAKLLNATSTHSKNCTTVIRPSPNSYKKAKTSRGQWCSALNCKNSRGKNIMSYFRFPREEERAKNWVKNAKRWDLMKKTAHELNVSNVLCRVHFELDQFRTSLKNRLIKGAIPTLFDFGNGLPPPAPLKELPSIKKQPQSKSCAAAYSNSNIGNISSTNLNFSVCPKSKKQKWSGAGLSKEHIDRNFHSPRDIEKGHLFDLLHSALARRSKRTKGKNSSSDSVPSTTSQINAASSDPKIVHISTEDNVVKGQESDNADDVLLSEKN